MVIIGFCMGLWVVLSLMILFHQPKNNTPGVVLIIVILGFAIFVAAHGMQDAYMEYMTKTSAQ